MPDAITEYVEQVCDKKIKDSQCVMAVPASVKKVLSNGMCLVRLIANDTELVIPNWSGCDVVIGDEVRVFFTGSIISERTAYIGAATYVVNRQWGLIEGDFIIDEGSVSPRHPKGQRAIPISIDEGVTIFRYGFRAFQKQAVLATFNGIIQAANSNCATRIEFYIDNQEYGYKYIMDMPSSAHYYCPTVTLPINVDEGNHVFEVRIFGDNQHAHIGYYEDAHSFIVGQGLVEVEVNDG